MSIINMIARKLIRKEMQDRALKKARRFPVFNGEIEVVCKGDWADTHAENFDIQLRSDQYGLILSAHCYEELDILRLGGVGQCFTEQNEQLLNNRSNVILAEALRQQEDNEKIVLRTMYQADRNGVTYLYDLAMVCFKRKQRYIWLMMNGQPAYLWAHREQLEEFIQNVVCTAAETAAVQQPGGEKSLALRVAEAFGCAYQILPPETAGELLVKMWKQAEHPGTVPLLVVPDECFLDMAELPVYPQPEEKGWPDAEQFLWQRLNELKESYDSSAEDQAVWRETLEWDSGKEPPEGGTLYVDRTAVKEAGGFLLLFIPSERSWDIFRKIPFGGWNACPDNLEIMAVSRYWRQKYGAVPILLGRDTLQYYLKQPPREEEISSLALEMFGFCEDIVFQGTESVRELGKTLRNSHLWFFWWD